MFLFGILMFKYHSNFYFFLDETENFFIRKGNTIPIFPEAKNPIGFQVTKYIKIKLDKNKNLKASSKLISPRLYAAR